MPYDETSMTQHRLELDGRERLLVTGVEEVERFDEEEIVMATTAGTLVVGGNFQFVTVDVTLELPSQTGTNNG